MAQVTITLTKSPIGAKKNQKDTLKALKLTKMHKSVELEMNDYVKGQIQTVSHLVTVVEEQ